MGGGGKVPYPKHVWSPAGGWYAQPANWKANTVKLGIVTIGILAVVFKISADREVRAKMPEPDAWCPSRHWSKEIREHEAKMRGQKLVADS